MKKVFFIYTIMVLIFIVSAFAANAKTYYVSNSGQDNNTGLSASTPIKTIAKVNSLSLNPGDSVLFKRGDLWRESLYISKYTGNLSGETTFGSYGTGDKPILMGSIDGDNSSFWTKNGANLFAAPLGSSPYEVFNIYYNTKSKQDTPNYGNRKTSLVELTNNWDFYWDSASKRVLVYNNIGSPDTQANGIELPSLRTSGESLIFNNGRDFVTIKDLNIKYTRFRGIYNFAGNNFRVSNTDFSFGYEKSIYQTGEASNDKILIQNCTFYQTGLRGTQESSMGETIWIASTKNALIKDNYIKGAHGVGINVWHSEGISIENNIIEDCEQEIKDWPAGIYFDGCENSIATKNTIENCTVGLSVNAETAGSSSQNINLTYNKVLKNKVGLVVNCNQETNMNNDIKISHNTFYRDSYSNGFYQDILLKYFTNLKFQDNIIYNNYTTNNGALLTWENSESKGLDSNFNIWYSVEGRNIFATSDIIYSNISEYSLATGQDKNSKLIKPLFSDSKKNDFQPISGSPACNMSSTGSYVGALPCKATTTPVCGDKTCNGNENCSTCSADCGACPVHNTTITACNLQDKSWNEGLGLKNVYNLSACFVDPLKTTLSFKASGNSSIKVSITNGMVTLNASPTWNGSEQVRFIATSGNRSASTNTVTLRVIDVPRCGDRICNGNENCSTCSADCGACPVHDTTITACNLQDKSWNEDEELVNAYDLGECFSDSLKTTLKFRASGNNSIKVSISSGLVNLSTPVNWSGTEQVKFTATSGNRSASTNTVTLTVNPVADCENAVCESDETCSSCSADCGECSSGTGEGGGGGGRGGSSSDDTTTYNWVCGNWSECIDRIQTQVCVDSENNLKKTSTQDCIIVVANENVTVAKEPVAEETAEPATEETAQSGIPNVLRHSGKGNSEEAHLINISRKDDNLTNTTYSESLSDTAPQNAPKIKEQASNVIVNQKVDSPTGLVTSRISRKSANIVSTIILFFTIITVIVLVVKHNQKQTPAKIQSIKYAEEYINKVTYYVIQAARQGFSRNQVITALINANYQNDVIRIVMARSNDEFGRKKR
jgi:parallel beta-helix repeat protein